MVIIELQLQREDLFAVLQRKGRATRNNPCRRCHLSEGRKGFLVEFTSLEPIKSVHCFGHFGLFCIKSEGEIAAFSAKCWDRRSN